MSTPDTEELVRAIVAGIVEQHKATFVCPVDPERRMLDHEWVLLQREKERERIEFWRSMKLHAAKWGMVSVISFLLYALWLALKHELLK